VVLARLTSFEARNTGKQTCLLNGSGNYPRKGEAERENGVWLGMETPNHVFLRGSLLTGRHGQLFSSALEGRGRPDFLPMIGSWARKTFYSLISFLFFGLVFGVCGFLALWRFLSSLNTPLFVGFSSLFVLVGCGILEVFDHSNVYA